MQNANLLFYMNLSGEVFYIIAHRMKSQKVKADLQQRVFNDLAISICHPTIVQNLVKGSLQILEMNMSDIRILMDRIVHSSIMTVNAYSMEKLFELTLIATRYQYTVCQHPKDILLIALNHLDAIRRSITDVVGMQLCENLHRMLVDRLKGETSMAMQEYRYAVLTYLADVKLKMTNLIKLGKQKPTGEFVKEADRVFRNDLHQPGTIEVFGKSSIDDGSESDTSDSNNETTKEELDEEDADNSANAESNIVHDEDQSFIERDRGCHFDPEINPEDGEDDDEILEVEYEENNFQEILESDAPEKGKFIVRFTRNNKQTDSSDRRVALNQFKSSLDLDGPRGTHLGESIYEIPGNSDDEEVTTISQSSTCTTGDFYPGQNNQFGSKLRDTDLDAVDLNAVQGLDLCSILLGCKQNSDASYKSPLAGYRGTNNENNLPGILPEENWEESPSKCSTSAKSPMTGVNVVKFDVRTDRSNSKSALSKISKEFDIDSDHTDQDDPKVKADLLFDISDD